MAILKIYPSKDTFITNIKRNNVQQTGSNFGASEILEVFKKKGISGSSGVAGSASFARILMKFDLTPIAELTASGKAPTLGSSYYLKLSNAIHADTLPTSFDLDIVPMSSSWTEGTGIDNDEYLDKGTCNWIKSGPSTYWSSQGGDYLTSSINTASFTTGEEDVKVDITNIVGAWLTGGLENHGLMLKLTDTEETNSLNYYRKKFHARNTNFPNKRPNIEMRWDDSIKDDRDNFVFNASNTLFLYNKVRGTLTNIPNVASSGRALTVTIKDVSGSFIQQLSASHIGQTGIYSASFVFTSASYTGSTFYDVWHSSSVSYMTGSFTARKDDAFQSNDQGQYIVKIKNLKKEYERNETVRMNMFIRTKNYNPAVVRTGSLELDNTVITKGYYRIQNAITGKEVVELGTGSLEFTRLSYDKNGNYFNVYMESFAENEVYKIVFFFNTDGEFKKVDPNIKFRVIN